MLLVLLVTILIVALVVCVVVALRFDVSVDKILRRIGSEGLSLPWWAVK